MILDRFWELLAISSLVVHGIGVLWLYYSLIKREK